MNRQNMRPAWYLLAGGVLLLIAIAVLGTNEDNVLVYRAAAQRHGGVVVHATQSGPTQDNNGEMVLVSGVPDIVTPPLDKQFGVSADVPILGRVTEMFQWREIDVDGDLSYELEWVDHPVDWRSFRHSAHHRDPDQMPFGSATFHAPVVKLAGFRLGATIVHAMPGRVEAKPDFSHLRPNMAASFRVNGNKLLSSAVPDSPQLGDLRVSWWSAPLQTVTVIARNYKGTLKPATDATDGKGFGLQIGQREVVDLEPDLPPEPLWPWLWRVLSLVLASLGAYALLRGAPACRSDGIAAVGLGVTVICGLAGVMWLVAVPKTGIGLIVIAVLALVVVAWRLHDRSPRTKRT